MRLLASSSTKIINKDINRVVNIKNASDSIDEYVINPGEEFSFNKVLGERTIEKGYKIANSISNGKIVKSVGGGICQVSTTLNMSVKKLGLDIKEVHIHSRPVDYAKREDEAAVSWNEKDYIFLNNTRDRIKIESRVEKDKVIVSLYSI